MASLLSQGINGPVLGSSRCLLSKRRSVDDVHTKMSRERVVRYPHGCRSELLLTSAPHLTQRGILIEVGYSLKLGTFRVLRQLVMRHVGGQSEANYDVSWTLSRTLSRKPHGNL